MTELAAMKAQLAHIKMLMEDGVRMRDSELEQDVDVDSEECGGAGNHNSVEFGGLVENLPNVTYESSSSCDRADKDDEEKPVFGNVPTLEEMNVIGKKNNTQTRNVNFNVAHKIVTRRFFSHRP